MKNRLHSIFIIYVQLFLLLSLLGCNDNVDKLTITNVQYTDDIYKPNRISYDYGLPICSKADLERYKTRRLGQKLEIIRYDKSIKIRILEENGNTEFVLDKLSDYRFCGEGISAVLDEKLLKKTLTIKISTQKELPVNLAIFDKIAEIQEEQGVTGFGGKYSVEKSAWLYANRGIILTARN